MPSLADIIDLGDVPNIRSFDPPDERTGAIVIRLLDDGRELCVVPRIFNTILTIGPAGLAWFDDYW